VLYSVLFETSVESESITLYSKFQIKINHIFGWICRYNVNKVVVEIMEMDDKELSMYMFLITLSERIGKIYEKIKTSE
jgi:hypothetical protein